MRSLFKSARSYSFRLCTTAALPIATNGAGSLLSNLSWSPLVTTYAEYSTLAALFDETKLSSARLDVISAFGPSSTAVSIAISIAPDYNNISVTPTYALVARLPEVRHFSCYNFGSIKGCKTIVAKPPRAREWCITSAPATASPIPAGWCGQWDFGNDVAGTATINYLFTKMIMSSRFRMRA
jgi:hypothetical protein